MSDIVKVKPKKDFEWSQDNKCVYIRITIPNTSINKIQIYLSDLVLRVTSLDKKSTQVFDLWALVNYKSKENKFIYANNILLITLIKEKQQLWKQLNISLPINQLKQRRKQSEARYEKTTQQIEQKKQLLRDRYDKKATQQLMRFEQQQRNILETKKTTQKSQAIKQIYKDINQEGKITKKTKQTNWDEKQKLALELLEKQQEQQKIKQLQLNKQKKKNNNNSTKNKKSLFTQQQIQNSETIAIKNAQQFQQIPIRKATNVSMKFTQKLYPGVATRDSHFKQPPIPKNKNSIKNNQDQDLQQKNPLWLKDKGDKLIKNKDYLSAINAFNTALKLDPKFLTALLNRSYCHMKLFNFDECLSDCEEIKKIMQTMINQQQDSKSKKTFCKVQIRKAMCLSWKGQLQKSKQIFTNILLDFQQILDGEQKSEINDSINLIDNRIKSNVKKMQGDIEFKKANYQKSLDLYQQSIQIQNSNQYSISNKALALLKLSKNRQAIQNCDRSLYIIQKILQNIHLDSQSSNFQASKILIKIYLRKASALKNLGSYKQSLQVTKKATILDQNDKQSKKLEKQIEILINKQNIKQIKQQAATFLKQGKFQQALQKYNQGLKIIDSTQVLQYLAILQNKCVCFLKLKKFDDIISTAIRSLKIIHNQQNRLVAFDNSKINKEEKQKLAQFEIRILVRRANAYSQLGQFYNAKSDLQRALQINPQNVSIKGDLEKLKKSLQK